MANSTFPVEFLNENIEIQLNLINASFKNKIKHFINLGSSCIYPNNFTKHIKEEYLLTSTLEKTNEAYEKGVFGAPTFVVNNKIFWGQDRIEFAIREASK